MTHFCVCACACTHVCSCVAQAGTQGLIPLSHTASSHAITGTGIFTLEKRNHGASIKLPEYVKSCHILISSSLRSSNRRKDQLEETTMTLISAQIYRNYCGLQKFILLHILILYTHTHTHILKVNLCQVIQSANPTYSA